jgi:hypothetical protein
MPAMTMFHAQDPREEIWEKIGDLDEWKVFHNEVLIAVYMRPDTVELKGGNKLYLSDQTRAEDAMQGKAGMVLKKGPLAFVSDDNFDFRGQDVEPGDWISIWVSDGRKVMVNGVLCRLVADRDIQLGIPRPDAVW